MLLSITKLDWHQSPCVSLWRISVSVFHQYEWGVLTYSDSKDHLSHYFRKAACRHFPCVVLELKISVIGPICALGVDNPARNSVNSGTQIFLCCYIRGVQRFKQRREFIWFILKMTANAVCMCLVAWPLTKSLVPFVSHRHGRGPEATCCLCEQLQTDISQHHCHVATRRLQGHISAPEVRNVRPLVGWGVRGRPTERVAVIPHIYSQWQHLHSNVITSAPGG